jgi:hypothetical protein
MKIESGLARSFNISKDLKIGNGVAKLGSPCFEKYLRVCSSNLRVKLKKEKDTGCEK